MKVRRKKLLLLVAAAAMTIAIAAEAAVQTTVTLTTVSGSRLMTVKSLSGTDLSALALGSARSAGFVVNVSDLAYDRRNYQVTGMMSNLYKFDAVAGTYDCAGQVASNKMSIGFLTNPTSVRDVLASAQPALDLTGSITGLLATALGLSSGSTVTSPVTQQLQDFTNSNIFTGIEDALPIKVTTGSGGTFTNRAPHAACDASATGATSVQVQAGNVSSQQDLLSWVQTVENSIFSTAAGGDGILTGAEAVTAGMITQSSLDDAVRTALTSAPLNVNPLLITNALLSQVEGLLTATGVPSVSSILKQTGSYTSLPNLLVGDLSGVPTGLYRGTMTVTLIEE